MKKILLSIQIFLDNWLMNGILLVFAALVAVLLHFTVSEYVKYSERLILARDYGLQNQILVGNMLPTDDINRISERLAEASEEVIQLPGVARYAPASFGITALDEYRGNFIPLECVNEEYYGKTKYALAEGSWPNAPNEVALTAEAMALYSIGDNIEVTFYLSDMNDNMTSHESTIEIVGFVDENVAIWELVPNVFRPGLDELTTTLKEYADNYSPLDERMVFGYIIEPTTASGERIELIYQGGPYLITVNADTDPEDIKPQLIEIFGGGRVHTGPEMIHRYKVEHNEEYLQLIRFAFISLVLTMSSLFAAVFLQLRKKRLEMTVYYICGTSWAQSLWFFTGSYYPLITMGSLVGSAIYFKLAPQLIRTDPMTVVVILVFLLTVCSIQVLPSYFSARRIHPTEWIRKD